MSLTAGEAVWQLLSADATTTTTRGTKIFNGMGGVPSGTETPFQVYTEIDNSFDHHIRGNTGIAFAEVRLDHYADTEADVRTLADAARSALDDHTGTVTDGADSIVVKSIKIQDESTQPVAPRAGQDTGPAHIRQEFSISYTLS